MIGIELVKTRVSKELLDNSTSRTLFTALLKRGLLSMSYEPKIRLYPPLNITRELFDEGLDIIEAVFGEFGAQV
jgi:4-aminobutyrate aminotransferase-like enzyme